MTRIVTSIVALTLVLSAVPAAADTHRHQDAAVSFDLPEGWTIETDEDDDFEVGPADESVEVYIFTVDENELEAAIAELKRNIAEEATSTAFGEPAPLEINGLDTRFLEGKATIDGEESEIAAAFYRSPAGKVLVVLAYADAEKMESHREAIGLIVQSVRP